MKHRDLLVNVLGKYRVHVEEYGDDASRKTIILVNGALATTTSFNQTVRYMRDNFNVILYDLPYAGRSKPHNDHNALLTKDDEVDILLALIERYNVNYVASVSWGGVAALLALARRPPCVEKAVITSFSPHLNAAMHDYLTRAQAFMVAKDTVGGAHLLNNTVGKYLPRLIKHHNQHYLASLGEDENIYEQVVFHIHQILELTEQNYVDQFSSIKVPVLFINGELDEYTTMADAKALAVHITQSRFVSVEGASHFLELESKQAWRCVRDLTTGFLLGQHTGQAAPAGMQASHAMLSSV